MFRVSPRLEQVLADPFLSRWIFDVEILARYGAPDGSQYEPARVPSAVGAALSIALAEDKGKTISVLMAYSDRLERFTRWYVQLWAESLGKNGKGTTPVAALGPVDQHSQVQLFIAGPRDKLFNVVTVGAAPGRAAGGTAPGLAPGAELGVGAPGFAGAAAGLPVGGA